MRLELTRHNVSGHLGNLDVDDQGQGRLEAGGSLRELGPQLPIVGTGGEPEPGRKPPFGPAVSESFPGFG